MTSLKNLNDDLNFGIEQEKRFFKQYLKPRHQDAIHLGGYSTFDFKCGNRYFELKARQYYKERFDKEGHMCDPSKIRFIQKNPHLKCKIYFIYYDGLYVFRPTSKKLDNIQWRTAGRADRGKEDEAKLQAFIKGEDLKLITTKLQTPKKLFDQGICFL